ncbi:MAG: hypothetical protein Q4D68_04700 [Moraxella equi]|nr:hypothetical protein [Moraxella equi]
MKILKRSATALIIAGANMLFSQSALAHTTVGDLHNQQSLCSYGYNPNCSNNSGYGNNTGSNYPSQPTMRTECQMLNNGYQSCIHYSLSTGAITFKEMINPKTSRPISQIFYHYNGQISSEKSFDEQGKEHGTHKDYRSTGQLFAVEIYEHGKKISGEYDNNNGTVTKVTYEYTPSQKIEHRRVYVNGKQHGLENKQFYHEKSKKWVTLYEVNWVNGKKHGTEKFYSLINDKGRTKLDKTVEWNNGVQVR